MTHFYDVEEYNPQTRQKEIHQKQDIKTLEDKPKTFFQEVHNTSIKNLLTFNSSISAASQQFISQVGVSEVETSGASEFSFTVSSNYSKVKPSLNILNPITDFYEYNFQSVKVKAHLHIIYYVPQDTRIIKIETSALSGFLKTAQTAGFEGEVSDSLESNQVQNRYLYVTPLSVIQQDIDLPEVEFKQADLAQTQFSVKISSQLLNGVAQ